MEPLGAASMSSSMPSKSKPTVSGSKYLSGRAQTSRQGHIPEYMAHSGRTPPVPNPYGRLPSHTESVRSRLCNRNRVRIGVRVRIRVRVRINVGGKQG